MISELFHLDFHLAQDAAREYRGSSFSGKAALWRPSRTGKKENAGTSWVCPPTSGGHRLNYPRVVGPPSRSRVAHPWTFGRGHLEVAMSGKQRQVVEQPQSEPTGCLPVVLRIIWMGLGNLALFISAALVAEGTVPVVMDIVFFAVAISLIVVRYVDITKFKGQTSDGEPATIAHWRRYSVVLALLAVGLWVLARVAASRGWM